MIVSKVNVKAKKQPSLGYLPRSADWRPGRAAEMALDTACGGVI
jgi:hypothetical protein